MKINTKSCDFVPFLSSYIILTLLISSVVSYWFIELRGGIWDWDINHFMYFGQRLDFGQLHWQSEFDDKLPLNQFLFWFPGKLKSIFAWQLMSIASSVMGAGCVFALTRASLESIEISAKWKVFVSLACSLLTLFGFTFITSGIHHVNPMAVSFALCSQITLLHYWRTKYRQRFSILLFFCACLCAAISVSIRPYLILIILFAPIWVILFEDFARTTKVPNFTKNIVFVITFFCVFGLTGLMINFIPLLLFGKFEIIMEGLRLLSLPLIKQDFSTILLHQLLVFNGLNTLLKLVVFVWCSGILFLIYKLLFEFSWIKKYNVLALNLISFTIVFPFLLEFMIAIKHFWHHYFQLLVPYISISVGVFLAFIFQGKRNFIIWKFLYFKPSLFAVMLFPSLIIAYGVILCAQDMKQKFQRIGVLNAEIEQLKFYESSTLNIKETLLKEDEGFLAPDNMYVHWKFEEQRHGFPHSANTSHISYEGWWAKLDLGNKFDIPNDLEEYCDKLNRQGPKVLVFFKSTKLALCANELPNYQMLDLAKTNKFNQLKQIGGSIFVRK